MPKLTLVALSCLGWIAASGCKDITGPPVAEPLSAKPSVAVAPGHLLTNQGSDLVLTLRMSGAYKPDYAQEITALKMGVTLENAEGGAVSVRLRESGTTPVYDEVGGGSGSPPFVEVIPTAPLADGWYTLKLGIGVSEWVIPSPVLRQYPDGRHGVKVRVGSQLITREVLQCKNPGGSRYMVISFSEPAILDGTSLADGIVVRNGSGEQLNCTEAANDGSGVTFGSLLDRTPLPDWALRCDGLTDDFQVQLTERVIAESTGQPVRDSAGNVGASFALDVAQMPVLNDCHTWRDWGDSF